MKTRELGQGLKVSEIGLGCMGLSNTYGDANEHESVATIALALERGVTFFDTADIYGNGHNEQLVGRALRKRSAEVVIGSKFGFVVSADGGATRVNGRPDYARTACDASLTRLGVETIDLYYLHRVDPAIPVEETVGALADLVRLGKVRHIGLSEASPQDIRRAHAVLPLAAVQSEWSLWTREHESNGVLSCVRELGIGFVAFSSLSRGFLAGQICSPADLGVADLRRSNPRLQGQNFDRNRELAESLRDLAAQRGCSPSQLALAWLLAQGDDVVPIRGTKRVAYLEQNIEAAALTLTDEELRQLDSVFPNGAAAGPRYAQALSQSWDLSQKRSPANAADERE